MILFSAPLPSSLLSLCIAREAASTTATTPAVTLAMTQPLPPAREKAITRLPQYFPTSCKQCATQTDTFFRCFEAHAVMMDGHDVTTAKTSLQHCQTELREYMTCMEKYLAAKNKHWWKVW
ncbi:hypothetical protein, conserved [Leishmania donovani]|uniref:Uncharacterized protein n=2 Tax=Leishmania donovani TaxID=5661 RepID=E9BHS5_LEIDO|nr:hypothetical protein, conserved [Leishmania donovani]CBZ34801.1 hypothetical protein, conserved [Leishmania donovani]